MPWASMCFKPCWDGCCVAAVSPSWIRIRTFGCFAQRIGVTNWVTIYIKSTCESCMANIGATALTSQPLNVAALTRVCPGPGFGGWLAPSSRTVLFAPSLPGSVLVRGWVRILFPVLRWVSLRFRYPPCNDIHYAYPGLSWYRVG